MVHDRESQDLAAEKMFEAIGSTLGGLGGFLETAERIITSLGLIAKSVQSMEEDGSLSRLIEVLERVEQERSTKRGDSHSEKRTRHDEDDV